MRIQPSALSTTYAPMVLWHSPRVVRLESTSGRVKPAAMGTALLNNCASLARVRSASAADVRIGPILAIRAAKDNGRVAAPAIGPPAAPPPRGRRVQPSPDPAWPEPGADRESGNAWFPHPLPAPAPLPTPASATRPRYPPPRPRAHASAKPVPGPRAIAFENFHWSNGHAEGFPGLILSSRSQVGGSEGYFWGLSGGIWSGETTFHVQMRLPCRGPLSSLRSRVRRCILYPPPGFVRGIGTGIRRGDDEASGAGMVCDALVRPGAGTTTRRGARR